MESAKHLETYDVVVLGGGIIGVSIARRLAMEGLATAVVERDRPGCGATNAASGMLTPQTEAAMPGPFLDLCLSSRQLIGPLVEEIEEETGVCVDYSSEGLICLALSEGEELELEDRRQWQEEMGLNAQRLDRDELLSVEPSLKGSRAISGILFPDEGRIDNIQYLKAMTISARRYNAQICEGRLALEVETKNDRVSGVRCADGEIKAPVVVNTLGCWAGTLQTPIPPIPMEPLRGQIVSLLGKTPIFKRPIKWGNAYAVPRSDGRILLGSTAEMAGFEARNTAEGVSSILDNALDMAPLLKELTFADAWSGLRPQTPDREPILGKTDLEGYYLATGHFRNGMLLSPVTAWLMGDLILKGKTAIDLKPFSPKRFESRS